MSIIQGQNVKFHRNWAVKSDSVIVKFISNDEKLIIIELDEDISKFGWSPNTIQTEKFSLNEGKKHLFVSKEELIVAI